MYPYEVLLLTRNNTKYLAIMGKALRRIHARISSSKPFFCCFQVPTSSADRIQDQPNQCEALSIALSSTILSIIATWHSCKSASQLVWAQRWYKCHIQEYGYRW